MRIGGKGERKKGMKEIWDEEKNAELQEGADRGNGHHTQEQGEQSEGGKNLHMDAVPDKLGGFHDQYVVNSQLDGSISMCMS